MYRYVTKLNTVILKHASNNKYVVLLQSMATLTDGTVNENFEVI